MVNEEILYSLRAAVAKGEPLKKAMMSFYNAGYPKKDIEEAARALQTPQFQVIPQTKPQHTQLKPVSQPAQQPPQTQPVNPSSIQPFYQQPPVIQTQKISNYAEKPKPMGMIITFILIFFLLVLVGILVAVFLFKNEISNFFNSVLRLLI